MARPIKQGLDYILLDTGFFDDTKLIDLNDRHGPVGEAVFMRLLLMIAKEGYYLELNEGLVLALTRSLGGKWVKNREQIKAVIRDCAECGLLHKGLHSKNVLTSVGIQKRYAYIKAKKGALKYDTSKYWLLADPLTLPEPNKQAENPNKLAENPNKLAENTHKEKKSKEDNIRKKEDIKNGDTRACARETYDEIITRLGYGQLLREKIFAFIQFLKLNGTVLTNLQFEQMLGNIEIEARLEVCGFYECKSAEEVNKHKREIETYIEASIEQALASRSKNLIPPKNYKMQKLAAEKI